MMKKFLLSYFMQGLIPEAITTNSLIIPFIMIYDLYKHFLNA